MIAASVCGGLWALFIVGTIFGTFAGVLALVGVLLTGWILSLR